MKVLIFGIGGVGGFLGGAVAESHEDTYFYARNNTKDILEKKGLRLDSVILGNRIVRPKLVSNDPAVLGKMDVIFITTKGNRLDEVAKELTPLIHEETVVIPLLNGILPSTILEPLLPPCHLADGSIRVFSHIESPGHVVQDGGFGNILFGMKDGKNPPLFQEIAQLVTNAGIPTSVVENMVLRSWQKFTITGTMSAILCYYDGTQGQVMAQKDHHEIIEAAHREVQEVAKAYGVHLTDSFIESAIKNFETLPPNSMSSLYRDFLAKKSAPDTELYNLIGYLVDAGANVHIPTPIFETAYTKFKTR